MARPAANVTACCSAIPTSKQRSGKRFWNRLSPVPPPIAAWMATMLSSLSASAIKDSAKYWVYVRVGVLGFNCFPDSGSNLTTPVKTNHQKNQLSNGYSVSNQKIDWIRSDIARPKPGPNCIWVSTSKGLGLNYKNNILSRYFTILFIN